MPNVVLGTNLQVLLKPGRLCTRGGECGWLVVRRRRNQYYAYLDTSRGEVYLGRLENYPPLPVALTLRYTGRAVHVDIDKKPELVEEAIGIARGIAEIKEIIPQAAELIDRILAKYKLI